jgi:hypothetical protein
LRLRGKRWRHRVGCHRPADQEALELVALRLAQIFGAIDVVELDGEIDHRDVFFSDHQKAANQKICACVSRARGTITLDTLQRADAI